MADRLLTPQQEKFLAEYTNPKSPTFGNALQSALSAGYSQEYAESITTKNLDWLADNVGSLERLRKAERILDKTLEMDAVDQEGKVDTSVLRIQADTAKFVASTVGKATYSTRTEVGGLNGQPLVIAFDPTFNATPRGTEEGS